MNFDFSEIRSHPHKLLSDHIRGVIQKSATHFRPKVAEIAALFHDIGKLNPNFQEKLLNKKADGYSNHAYLSAFAWISFCFANIDVLRDLGFDNINIFEITALLAHHHGNLPDFKDGIFSTEEFRRLKDFLLDNDLPFTLYLNSFENCFSQHNNFKTQNEAYQLENINTNFRLTQKLDQPLDIYLNIKFNFSLLLRADKLDAGDLNFGHDLQAFSECYSSKLKEWTQSFTLDSPLNSVRSEMQRVSVERLEKLMIEQPNLRVFSLTAPTGAGKTAILLSLANAIIERNGPLRITYVLPFLSITEQVGKICQANWGDWVQRIDSKAENNKLQEIQQTLDADQNEENIRELLSENFKESTFDYAFVITTFVRFFETLLSNKNATLLKLPNFSENIFLIDEIQALPPRLYSFFIAFLDFFCKKFNSYVIVSTATMPNFSIPETLRKENFFGDYNEPPELLDLLYFENDVFERYTVSRVTDPLSLQSLADKVKEENRSVLVILNTISDSQNLFKALGGSGNEDIYLLNTLFIPEDRQNIISDISKKLKSSRKVILVSTQLIEAGVDIDFPNVYRDLCTLSSLVQSAGRCNRNNTMSQKGKVVLIELQRDDGHKSWSFIYRGKDRHFIDFLVEKIGLEPIPESKLLSIQRDFFADIAENTHFAFHESNLYKDKSICFIKKIRELAFNELGKFKLIDQNEFGEELNFYVLESNYDRNYSDLLKLKEELANLPTKSDFQTRAVINQKVNIQLRKMANRILRVRLRQNDTLPTMLSDPNNPCFGIHLLDPVLYDPREGFKKGNDLLI